MSKNQKIDSKVMAAYRRAVKSGAIVPPDPTVSEPTHNLSPTCIAEAVNFICRNWAGLSRG